MPASSTAWYDVVSTSPEAVAIVALALSVIFLSFFVVMLHRKTDRFFAGSNAQTIEEALLYIRKTMSEQEKFREEVSTYLRSVEERLRRSTQGVATVRFNAFKGKGGGSNQSFATAFIDESGNGVVISSIQFRDHVGIYAKPMVKYETEYELTTEEKTALAEAKKKVNKKTFPKND